MGDARLQLGWSENKKNRGVQRVQPYPYPSPIRAFWIPRPIGTSTWNHQETLDFHRHKMMPNLLLEAGSKCSQLDGYAPHQHWANVICACLYKGNLVIEIYPTLTHPSWPKKIGAEALPWPVLCKSLQRREHEMVWLKCSKMGHGISRYWGVSNPNGIHKQKKLDTLW